MALVAYPYHVKHNGIEYAPNAPIEVDDAEAHVSVGARLIAPTSTESETTAKKPRKRKTGGD